MKNDFNLLDTTSWLGILTMVIQYDVNNFYKPKKWNNFNKEPDPRKRDEIRKIFIRNWNLIIIAMLGSVVIIN